MRPGNFSWLIPGVLAGCAKPGLLAPLEADLAALAAEGVRLVVSLTEEPLPGEALAAQGLEAAHLPVVDYTPPSPRQLARFVALLEEAERGGRPVVVHCLAGKGRTGTLLAVALVARGSRPEGAVARVRQLRPGSIETPAQERAVQDFAASVGAPIP